MKSEPRKKFFLEVTQQTETIKQQLFEDYPCLQLKFRLRSHANYLKELILNEAFAEEIGYSMETLPTIVLKEGFPQ